LFDIDENLKKLANLATYGETAMTKILIKRTYLKPDGHSENAIEAVKKAKELIGKRLI